MDNPSVVIAALLSAAQKAKTAIPKTEGDYISNGILHCGKCHTPMETTILLQGQPLTVRCLCACRAEQEKREKEEREARERADKADAIRSLFPAREMSNWTFANDDLHNPKVSSIARNYCNHYAEMRIAGKGLVFHGPVGTGKSYYATAIANELIDRGYRVYLTSFSRLGNMLYAATDKQQMIDDICRYDMLVIDDLGAERSTAWSDEMVYNVIESRYQTRLPLIITTNLTLQDMTQKDSPRVRIYSRLLEMCHFIPVDGADRRKQKMRQSKDTYMLLFDG